MGPLEPKAISLCFFSKLVLQSSARVVHDAHTSSPLPQCVLSAGSVLGGFATGNTLELAPSRQISSCHMEKIALQQPGCVLLLGLPCPAAKLCSSWHIGSDSAAGRGTPALFPKAVPCMGNGLLSAGLLQSDLLLGTARLMFHF